jgi:hypothetical protein
MSNHLVSAIPVLPIQDLEKSLSFYRERLGFSVAFQFGPYAGVEREGIEIHLSVEDAQPVTCRVSVRGVDGLFEEFSAQQVIHPEEPLATQPWGMRQFSVLDPSGNRITFAEAVAADDAPERRAYVITFTHIEGAAANVAKDDIPKLIQSHQEWERDVETHPNSSLVYFGNPSDAKTVRLDASGELSVHDGPYTGGPEAAGGFYIVEAESLEGAVEIAKRHRWMPGSNEVRELAAPPGAGWWIRAR